MHSAGGTSGGKEYVVEQQVSGALADGRTYRATSYLVEVLDADGSVVETIDMSEIRAVHRSGLDVTFTPRKGKRITLRGETVSDAGRLEAMVRQAVPATPVKQSGGIGSVFKWGCLGTLALIAVIVVVTMASSGDSNDGGTTASSGGATSSKTATAIGTKEVGTNKGDVHVPLAEGVTGEVQDGNDKLHRVTIVKITDNATSSNMFEEPAEGKKFWVVEVLVENAGPAELSLGSWKLRTSDDFEHDQTFAVGLGDLLDPIMNLTSGAKTQGIVVFEIAADATPKFLRYDPNVFTKGDLYFDAE